MMSLRGRKAGRPLPLIDKQGREQRVPKKRRNQPLRLKLQTRPAPIGLTGAGRPRPS